MVSNWKHQHEAKKMEKAINHKSTSFISTFAILISEPMYLIVILQLVVLCYPYIQQSLKGNQKDDPLHSKKLSLVPNYDIEKEMLSIPKNIETKMREVPQIYQKWEEKWEEVEVLNVTTGKIEIQMNKVIDYVVPRTPMLPLPDPRDTHLELFISSETKKWRKFLIEQRSLFRKNKFVFFAGEQTREVLKHLFDATEEDLDVFENVSDNMNHDPTVPCRKMSNYRLGMDLKNGVGRRLTREPYILSAAEGLVGKNTGKHRFFGEVQDWVIKNSAFQGLIRLKAFMMKGNLDISQPRQGCDSERNFSNTGNFHRVFSLPNMTGNPTLEGVHQDGTEFIMTTFIKSQNIDFDSGAASTFLVTNDQPLGTQYYELDQKNLIQTIQMRNYLDSIFFDDQAMSHVLSPIYVKDKEAFGFRDVFVSKSRHLAKKEGHSSSMYDNENSHLLLPQVFSLYSKHLMKDY